MTLLARFSRSGFGEYQVSWRRRGRRTEDSEECEDENLFAPVSHVNQKATVCAREKGLARDDSAGLGMIRSSTRFHPTPGRSCRLSLNRTLAISREKWKRNFRGSHELAAHVHDGLLTLCSALHSPPTTTPSTCYSLAYLTSPTFAARGRHAACRVSVRWSGHISCISKQKTA